MSTLNYDIDGANSFIDDPRKYSLINTGGIYGKYAPFYTYTTENIRDYMNIYPIENKKVLTVCGSGDQALNAILMGASKVEVFDVNTAAILFLSLKKAAVIGLSLEEFIYNLKRHFPKQYYIAYRSYIPKDIRIFWDKVYGKYNDLSYFNFLSSKSTNEYVRRNIYLESSNYIELKKLLKTFDIKTIRSNITELNKTATGHYDLILLSNILDHLRYESSALDQYKSLLENEIIPLITKDGYIQCAYIYFQYFNNDYYSSTNNNGINGVFSDECYETTKLPHQDYVLTYHKGGNIND